MEWKYELYTRQCGITFSVLQVARLLLDTSVSNFYPTLFVLATDILDMVGDMVWERIKEKAEFAEDGTRHCSLPGLPTILNPSHSLFLFFSLSLLFCIFIKFKVLDI